MIRSSAAAHPPHPFRLLRALRDFVVKNPLSPPSAAIIRPSAQASPRPPGDPIGPVPMVSESPSYSSATAAPPMTADISASAQSSHQRFFRGVYAPSPRSGIRPVLEHGYEPPTVHLHFRGVYAPSRCAALAVEPRRVRGLKPHSEKGHEWPSRRAARGTRLPVLKHGPNTA